MTATIDSNGATMCLECNQPVGTEPGLATEFAALCGNCAADLVAAQVAQIRAVAILHSDADEAHLAAAARVLDRRALDLDSKLWLAAWELGSPQREAARAVLMGAARTALLLDGEGDLAAALRSVRQGS